jgi:polysaccharide lyase-like protein
MRRWHTIVAKAALLVVAAVAAGLPHSSAAQVIRDDFNGRGFDRMIWAPCPRSENELSIVRDPALERAVARLTVRPRQPVLVLGLSVLSRNCRGEDPFDDGAERAEIWEAPGVRLSFGADVWYGFDMYIDGAVSPREDRLVVGQWKGPRDDSPMVAQRFDGRVFTITIEQPNRAPDHDPRDTQCRILVAHDANLPRHAETDLPHGELLFETAGTEDGPELVIASVGHDARGNIHGGQSCRTGVSVEPHNLLPDVFGTWVRMVYHLKIAGDEHGLLEVWANGVPIVTVRGQIGFPGRGWNDKQYFKFGPYRNQNQLPAIYAQLSRYARGPSKQDVQ